MDVNIDNILEVSKKYNIPEDDLYFMGLNLNGINMKELTNSSRLRFQLKPTNYDKPFFFAITNTENTPYKQVEDKVKIDDIVLGTISKIEEDTCDETYFRMNNKALTLNSNSRSECVGCEFCGSHRLEALDLEKLDTITNLNGQIEKIMGTNETKDLSYIDNIGIVTGCFKSESEAVNHILTVREAFKNHGFKGEIKYIGSQIRSQESLEILAKEPFGLYLTVECFENRKKLMKPVKSNLTIDNGIELLNNAKELGIETSFLYILGLDSLESIKQNFPKYKDVLTRHPIVNLMQSYKPEQNNLRNMCAHNLEYYSEARTIIEKIFESSTKRPRLWENYRSPWHTTYGGKKLDGINI